MADRRRRRSPDRRHSSNKRRGFDDRRRDDHLTVYHDLAALGDSDDIRIESLARAVERSCPGERLKGFVSRLLRCIIEMPWKRAHYAALIAQLNAVDTPRVMDRVVDLLEDMLVDAATGKTRSSDLVKDPWMRLGGLLEVVVDLTDAGVFSREVLLDVLEHLWGLVAAPCASEGDWTVCRRLVYRLLRVLPSCTALLGEDPRFSALVSSLQQFVEDDCPVPEVPAILSPWKMEGTEPGQLLHELWDAVRDRAGYPRMTPHTLLDLSRGHRYMLSIKAAGCRAPGSVPEIDAWTRLEVTYRTVATLLAGNTQMPEFEGLVLDELVAETFLSFYQSQGLCAKQLCLLPQHFSEAVPGVKERLLANIFALMFSLPQPGLSPEFYGSVLIALFHLASKDYGKVLGRLVDRMLRGIEALDPACRDRLSQWFAQHLSNFGLQWPWPAWVFVLDTGAGHPARVFITDTLALLARLTSVERVSTSLAAFPRFAELAPAALSVPDTAEDEDVARVQAGQVLEQGSTVSLVRTLLRAGGDSVSESFPLLTRHAEVLASHAPEDLRAAVEEFYKDQAPLQVLVLGFLVRQGMLGADVLLSWLFEVEEDNLRLFTSQVHWTCLLHTMEWTVAEAQARPEDHVAARQLKEGLLTIFQKLNMVLLRLGDQHPCFPLVLGRMREFGRHFAGQLTAMLDTLEMIFSTDSDDPISGAFAELKALCHRHLD